MRIVFSRVCLCLALLFALTPALAADIDLKPALSGFLSASFSSTEKSIEALAQSGAAQAPAIIEALQDERLYYSVASGMVIVKAKSGALSDAATVPGTAGSRCRG